MSAVSISANMGGGCIGLCPRATLSTIPQRVDDESRQAGRTGSRRRDGEATNNNQPSAGAAKAWRGSVTLATMGWSRG